MYHLRSPCPFRKPRTDAVALPGRGRAPLGIPHVERSSRRLRRLARRGRQVPPRSARRQPDLAHAGGHRRQAALHGGGHPGPAVRRHAAGVRAVRPRPAADDVRAAPVDDPPVRGLLDGRGIQRVLPAQSRRRRSGRLGRLRPRHAPRLRLRPPARRRRRRQGRRGHRLGRGHEDPVRRHPARPRVGVDDHERRRAAGARRLHRRRRGTGRAAGRAHGDHPERHPQGVHGPQHLHLPARRRRCGSSPTSSATRRSTCRSSTRSRSPATTCRRRARRRRSSWR